MGLQRESRTGIAVLAFIVASTAAQFNSPSDLRGDCTDKSDGNYPTGHCSTFFLVCSGGRTTKQNCSAGLWFNPQSNQCDYRHNIVACQDKFSCDDREDGQYGDGCSSMFWYCTGGKLRHSVCPNGTFYNVDAVKCDYRQNIRACGGVSNSPSVSRTRSNRLTKADATTIASTTFAPITIAHTTTDSTPQSTVRDWTEVPYGQTYPTYPPRQRISGKVSKTPLSESTAGTACAGKEDGSHAVDNCSGQYVLCWAGTGDLMNCQQGLKFNEEKKACDYPLNVAGCDGSSSLPQDEVAPSPYGTNAPPHSDDPSSASLPIPRQPVNFDCSSRSNGNFGDGCSRDFFQCTNGVAIAKRCTDGLVYNTLNDQCDYMENCDQISSTVISSDSPTTASSVVAPVEASIDFDCSSRVDGRYSRGCVNEFFVCSSGRVTLMKCPKGLVFDDVTKGCDFPEICSAPHSTQSTVLDSASSSYSSSLPVVSSTFDCSSRADGSYSEGCVAEFFECNSGSAYPKSCPSGLVFDGVSQLCEYPHKCGQPRPLEEDPLPSASYQQPPSVSLDSQTSSIAFDCSSRADGGYGGCSRDFFQCVSGMTYTMKCPEKLVFDEKTGNCDYPEKCGNQRDAVSVPVVTSPAEQPAQYIKPTLAPAAIDCFNRANGLYATGCSRSFIQCSNQMAFEKLCEEGLLFVQESGRCDFPSECGRPSEVPVSDIPSPSSAPYKPSVVNETPVPPKRDEPSGVLIDCTTLSDGVYSSGCTHAFVQCASSNAYPLECPNGLVFDKRVEKCVWPSECSSVPPTSTPYLPTVSLPIRPSDAPSTLYDMKEEKEEMVTDAPLPEVNNDGTVCTGTGRRSMGKCSSGFVQCIGGKLIARRCPGQSLFDEKIGLCVYDMDGCEMDVDVVDVTEQETPVSETAVPQQAVPLEAAPSYTQQSTHQTPYQQSPQSTSQQMNYQRGEDSTQYQAYQSGYQPAQAAPTEQYQTGYQNTQQYQTGYQNTQQYQTGYQPAPQYQNGYQTSQHYQTGYQPAQQLESGEYGRVAQYDPAFSSFGDSSLSSQSQSPECEIGSFRRVSACSPSFDECSPTARQWIRKVCGKSHRFDSSTNQCRPVFEVRECDEPLSSYVPPPVEYSAPAVYPDPSTSFEYGVPLSGREYEEKHVVDPFKGGYQSGRMGSNPFMAIGNTGTFYTEDGFSWIGSAWSEGGKGRRGGKRRHHNHGHSGDYVLVSGNPFGGRGSRVLNDEWRGRKEDRGRGRSSLAPSGHRVRNVVDHFKGRVSDFAPPLGEVNPFAVKRADGRRRRGRKNCRRDKHRRREDWDDEECEELTEKERPIARKLSELYAEEEEEGPVQSEDTESMDVAVDGEKAESETTESEKTEEAEQGQSDAELLPESIDGEKTEETTEGEAEVEEKEEETTTEMEEEEGEEGEEKSGEKDNGSIEGEETASDGETGEERAVTESAEPENAVEEMKEKDAEKEFEVEGETEPAVESKIEDELPGPVETEENEKREKEEDDEKIEETEELEEPEEENGEEGKEEDDGKTPESNEEPVEDDEDEDEEEETGVKEETQNEISEKDEEDGTTAESVEEPIEDDEEEEEEASTEKEEKPVDDEVKEEPEEKGESEEKEEPEVNEESEAKEESEVKEEAEDVEDETGSVEEGEKEVKESEEEREERPESIEEPEENGEEKESETENAVEEMKEKDAEKEFEIEGESEPAVESKIEDELPEPVETEETGETKELAENEDDEKIEEVEELEEPEDEKEESGEAGKAEDDGKTPESNEEPVEDDDDEDEEEETGVKEEETQNETSDKDEEDGTTAESVEEPTETEEKEEDEETASEGENVEERAEAESTEGETPEGELNEDDVDKEFEEDGEKSGESKTEDVESPESLEKEEKTEGEEVEGEVKEEETEGAKGGIEMRFDGKTGEKNTEEDGEGELEMNPEVLDGEKNIEEISEEREEDPEKPESIEGQEEETSENRRSRRSVTYSPSLPSRRLSLPRSSRLHRSRFSRLCSSSSTGQAISIGQCRQDFVYCKSKKRPVVAACPVGDLFDAVMSTCVPTEICGAEAAKMDVPSETPVSHPSYAPSRDGERPTMPSPTGSSAYKPALDETRECSSLPDGAHPVSACSPHYFVCAASIKYSYECPSNLVYDKPTDSCQWPREVAACNGVTADATPSYSYSGASMDVVASTAPSTISPMHVQFECAKDGGFPLDCRGGFVMCSNGVASMMRCPAALVFDGSSQSCQYPAHVGSCGLAPTSSPSLDVPSTLPPYSFFSTSTTSAPARAIETLVNPPVDKDACSGVETGLDGGSVACPSTFYICTEGRVTTAMNCAEGTFFNRKTQQCDYRENACAGGWSGEAHGVEHPIEQDVSTVVTESEEYGRRASRPYRPSLPLRVEVMEKKEEEYERKEEVMREEAKPVVVPSVESAKGATCDWKGTAPSGECSSQFIACSNGRPEVFDCTAGLVFASSISACQYPEFVRGCPQFKESSESSPALSDAVIFEETSSPSSSEYSREIVSTTTRNPLLPSKIGEHSSAKFEATGDYCAFSADQPAFPLNYCSMTYAVCTADGMAYRTNCTFGHLFDSVIRQCVPAEHCGQPYMKEIAGVPPSSSPSFHSTKHLSRDSRCVGVTDGTLKATSLCSSHYIRCEKESVVMESCESGAHIFSSLTGRCVLRVQMAECSSSPKGSTPAITRPKTPLPTPSSDALSSSPSSYPLPPSHRGARIRGGLSFPSPSSPFDASTFCTGNKADGLYRHPENCAGIVQCFGGEAFSYPSCAPGLFFNEVDSQCDYASNVPECASQEDPIALNDSIGSCKGQPHGSHLADDSDCSLYYRCVWGSMERLSCPEGTVFNPRLSVCDYPSEVPHCQKQ